MKTKRVEVVKMIVMVGLIILILKTGNGFYVPQSYYVKMYHHENLLMTGENEVQENSILNLRATDGYKHTFNSIRHKRGDETIQNSLNLHNYEDDRQYEGSIESQDDRMKNESYDYDYEKFRDEYYQEKSEQKTEKNETLDEENTDEYYESKEIIFNKTKESNEIKTAKVPMENYCSVVLLFRTRVMECLIFGISERNPDIIHRSSLVISFWLVMYIMTAGYLWCTRGWCCCCCPCSCCHPRSVLYEAKEFLAQNPPGVAQLHSRRKIYYEASQYENQCFKELEKEVFNF